MEFLKLLESIREEAFTIINLGVTKLGEETVIFAILCLVYWCINKKLGYQISFSYLIAGFFINVLKIIIQIPRPFVKDPGFTPVDGALKHATGFSFPSGHTQAATSVYGTLSLYFNKKNILISILLYIPILLVAFSRMYLGVHTPYDILAGFAIAILINILINYFFTNYLLDTSHYRIVLLIVTIFAFGLMLLGAYQMAYQSVPFNDGSDCFKVGSAILGFIIGWYIEVTKVNFREHATSLSGQIQKYLCGIIVVVALNKGTQYLLALFLSEKNLILYTVPYFLTTLWITGIYPIFIKKFFTSPYHFKQK